MAPFDNLPPPDDAWTDLLRPLREPELPEPRPYFYARLEARMAAEQPPPVALPWWLRRPAYAATLGTLVLALNAGAAVYYARHEKPRPPAPDGYAAFAADYQLDPFQHPHD
ncbi:hypothetical protein [Hymenobacter metallilatus]|uniref:Uncharacterized protein n=1 Tax=Hymenobacter metallilatus TaxID=2493666 RepID=A0A428IYW0_9BACT|nr:hypothetical protein [Hymenobacter metallilatus]RSK24508.1 hypothetical protein EI290_19350 [Hymenobacter metallilatus]